jgi:hypothetical protein
MPLVFVHGVATRQTPEYQATVRQRDTLFKTLVLPANASIFDPDWGSNGVRFSPNLPWLPEPGAAEAFAVGGGQGASNTSISRIASVKPDQAIDLAFAAGLEQRARAATKLNNVDEALQPGDVEAFKAAVRYLETGADRTAFGPNDTDQTFLTTLASEIKPHAAGAIPEAMGLADGLSWIGQGLKDLVDPIRNAASDTVLRLIRRPLSEQVALFLGDIFVYLRWREVDSAGARPNRIFAPIIEDLGKAAAMRSPADPLIVVCHSLGGVILYDLLSDATSVTKIESASGTKLKVDAWVTVGSQPGLFADMKLYSAVPGAGGLLPRPPPVCAWLNVYDYTDVLSFRCARIFTDVEDLEFDNISGVFEAHSAYFKRPSFYQKLRKRVKEAGQVS